MIRLRGPTGLGASGVHAGVTHHTSGMLASTSAEDLRCGRSGVFLSLSSQRYLYIPHLTLFPLGIAGAATLRLFWSLTSIWVRNTRFSNTRHRYAFPRDQTCAPPIPCLFVFPDRGCCTLRSIFLTPSCVYSHTPSRWPTSSWPRGVNLGYITSTLFLLCVHLETGFHMIMLPYFGFRFASIWASQPQ